MLVFPDFAASYLHISILLGALLDRGTMTNTTVKWDEHKLRWSQYLQQTLQSYRSKVHSTAIAYVLQVSIVIVMEKQKRQKKT